MRFRLQRARSPAVNGVIHVSQRERDTPKPVALVAKRREACSPEARGDESADERTEAEGRRQETETLWADVERVRCEEGDENVEVEADRADDGDDAEQAAELRVVPDEAEARRIPSTIRADGSRPTGCSPPAEGSPAWVTRVKLNVLMTKQIPVPATAITTPAIVGLDHARAVEEARVERDRVRQRQRGPTIW